LLNDCLAKKKSSLKPACLLPWRPQTRDPADLASRENIFGIEFSLQKAGQLPDFTTDGRLQAPGMEEMNAMISSIAKGTPVLR
jgi:hypothetical protein